MRGSSTGRRFPLPSPAWLLLLPGMALLSPGAVTPPGAVAISAQGSGAAPAVHRAPIPLPPPLPPPLSKRSAPPAAGRAVPVPADRTPVAATGGAAPGGVVAVLPSVWATAHFLYADFLGTCVACTSTAAGANRSAAEARGSRILSEGASEGQGPANGYSSGELLALPPNPLLHLALESWSARTSAAQTGSTGHADAAVLIVGLDRPGTLDLAVARASSDSSSSGSGSTGRTSVDGLTATLAGGALRLTLFHSETSDRGDGHAQLASVNGIVLLDSGNAMLPGSITVPRVVSLELLHAGSDRATAAAASDGKSQGVVGLSSGRSGGGTTTPPEPLH